jgi:hypothetical protein
MIDDELQTVYTTSLPADAEIIKGMLEAEGIRAMVNGESQGGFVGAIPEVVVVVREADSDRARSLIQAHSKE